MSLSIVPLTPRPHQVNAVADAHRELLRSRLAQVIMPCGTGKTLVGIALAQEMKARLVLVLVPSIALLAQAIDMWLAAVPGLLSAALCSDDSVGYDEARLDLGLLPVPVLSDSPDLEAFLKGKSRRVLFSTYQSTHKIADLALTMRVRFDLAIFDEAHTAATTPGNQFSRALFDEHLFSKKRLFMTATPRCYFYDDFARVSDLPLSMDNESVFGRVAHNLPFSKAVKDGLITDYKILASEVSRDDLSEAIEDGYGIKGRRGPVTAMQAALAVSLAQGVRQSGANKVIAYFNRVQAASRFTEDWAKYLSRALPGYQLFHVNGEMTSEERSEIMEKFAAAPLAIITNARCLGIGVDVPSVDMVAFMAPRRGFLDIVQNAGRALRTAPGKRFGYILIPVFADTDAESEHTRFTEVFAVLNELRNADDSLSHELDAASRVFGAGGEAEISESRLALITRRLDFAKVRRGIVTKFIEIRGPLFQKRIGWLTAFKAKYGHTRIPDTKEYRIYSEYFGRIRMLRKKGLLTMDKIRQLDDLGFNWSPQGDYATSRAALLILKAHVQAGGEVRVGRPGERDVNPPKVNEALMLFRKRAQQNRLPAEFQKELQAIGINLEPANVEFDRMLAAYDKHYADTGSVSPSSSDADLWRWFHKMARMLAPGSKAAMPKRWRSLLAKSPGFQAMHVLLAA